MPISKFALFCPVTKACEILEPRWTLLILTEMWWGSTRFNDIRRGVPGISPTLLSKRLKELEAHGLVERLENKATGTVEYVRTDMAVELEPIIQALGEWAYKNATSADALCRVDSNYLMWNLRRCILPEEMPARRNVIQFTFTDPGGAADTLEEDGDASRQTTVRNYWTITRPGTAPDVCHVDPGFDVDLFVISELPAMVSAFFGHSRLETEIESDRIQLIGSPILARTISKWFILSSYARSPIARVKDDGARPLADVAGL